MFQDPRQPGCRSGDRYISIRSAYRAQEQLSVGHAFPLLSRLERGHGSLTRGGIALALARSRSGKARFNVLDFVSRKASSKEKINTRKGWHETCLVA